MCKFHFRYFHKGNLNLTSHSLQDARIGWISLKIPCHPPKENEVTLSFSRLSPTIAHPMEAATMVRRRLHHLIGAHPLQHQSEHPQQHRKMALQEEIRKRQEISSLTPRILETE
jgi:hypothetical protein